MENGSGLMEVSGQAGQIGILENHQGETITILSSGEGKIAENGIMFQKLMEEEFYVSMIQQNNCSLEICLTSPHKYFTAPLRTKKKSNPK